MHTVKEIKRDMITCSIEKIEEFNKENFKHLDFIQDELDKLETHRDCLNEQIKNHPKELKQISEQETFFKNMLKT